MKSLRTASRIYEYFNDFVVIFVASVMIFMMLAISYDVVMRYFFNQPTAWVLGILPPLVLWATFLGAGWLLRKDGHVKIDIILNSLSPGKQRIANALNSIIGALVWLIIFWFGLKVSINDLRAGIWTDDIPSLPNGLILAVIPFGSLLLFFESMRHAYKYWNSK